MLAEEAYMQVSGGGGSNSCWGEEVRMKSGKSGTGRMDGDML